MSISRHYVFTTSTSGSKTVFADWGEQKKSFSRLYMSNLGYFSFGNGTRQFQALDEYVRMRLLRFYRRKTGSRAKGVRGRFEDWLKNSGIEPFFQKGIFGQAR